MEWAAPQSGEAWTAGDGDTAASTMDAIAVVDSYLGT